MTAVALRPAESPPPTTPSRSRARRVDLAVGAVALGAALARLPFIGFPLSADEGGFLLVASHWSPGTSLYGNYWVDRPPLLIAFFSVADELGRLGLGPAVALRALGIVIVIASVALAARLGTLVAARAGASQRATGRARLLPAVAAAVFLTTPLFDATEVNGEVVAVPLILLGLVAVLEADRATTPGSRGAWLFAAGAAGAAAVLVKQNELDVLVLAAVATVTMLPHTRAGLVARNLAALGSGALALTAVVLVWAAARGTSPVGLWDAVVTFRFQAAAVISSSSTAATTARLHGLLIALLLSGVALVPMELLANLRRLGRGPLAVLRWPVLAMLGWELFSVLAGGSYWLHYLVCLVPGVVLAVAVLAPGSSWPLQRLRLALGYAGVVALVAVGSLAAQPSRVGAEQPLVDWFAVHARPGDTALVAFGNPEIQRAIGLQSPYPQLWSLPVRVRDPHLTQFAGVLDGVGRPTWVVTIHDTPGTSLTTWGVDPTAGQAALDANYRVVATVNGHLVYRARSRDLA